MKWLLILCLALAMALSGFHESGASVTVTLEECRKAALMHSKELRIEEARRQQAHLRTREQRTHYLPKLSASGHYVNTRNRFAWEVDPVLFNPLGGVVPLSTINPATGRPINEVSGHTIMKQSAWATGIRAEQPLYMGGKIRAANRMAVMAEEISRHSIEAQRQSVLAEVDHTYWRYVGVTKHLLAAKAYVELLDALEAQVSHAVETGLVHRNELLKVMVRRNEALLEHERAKNGQELLRMSLCRLVGYDLDTPLDVVDDEIQVPPYGTLRENAPPSPRSRPDYRMLEGKVSLMKENETIVWSDFLPSVGLAAGYAYIDGVELYNTSLSSHGQYVMVSATVPLWQWGEGRYQRQSARLDSHIARLELENYEKLMELEIRQALFALSEAHRRCMMTATALKEANEYMVMIRDFYELGLGQLTDYLEAQARWQQVQAEHMSAKVEYKIQETNYRRIVGALP